MKNTEQQQQQQQHQYQINIAGIRDIIKDARDNALFAMILCAKEIFHSNVYTARGFEIAPNHNNLAAQNKLPIRHRTKKMSPGTVSDIMFTRPDGQYLGAPRDRIPEKIPVSDLGNC